MRGSVAFKAFYDFCQPIILIPMREETSFVLVSVVKTKTVSNQKVLVPPLFTTHNSIVLESEIYRGAMV